MGDLTAATTLALAAPRLTPVHVERSDGGPRTLVPDAPCCPFAAAAFRESSVGCMSPVMDQAVMRMDRSRGYGGTSTNHGCADGVPNCHHSPVIFQNLPISPIITLLCITLAPARGAPRPRRDTSRAPVGYRTTGTHATRAYQPGRRRGPCVD